MKKEFDCRYTQFATVKFTIAISKSSNIIDLSVNRRKWCHPVQQFLHLRFFVKSTTGIFLHKIVI